MRSAAADDEEAADVVFAGAGSGEAVGSGFEDDEDGSAAAATIADTRADSVLDVVVDCV